MKVWFKIFLWLAVIGSVEVTHQALATTACSLTLEWQPSPDANVAGYALYYSVAGAPLTNRLDVGTQTMAMVKNLTAAAEYSFHVVAYDADLNESEPSDPVIYTPPPISSLKLSAQADGTMRVSFRVAPGAACVVEYTDTLSPPNWLVLTNTVGDSNGVVVISDPISADGSRFYRGKTQ